MYKPVLVTLPTQIKFSFMESEDGFLEAINFYQGDSNRHPERVTSFPADSYGRKGWEAISSRIQSKFEREEVIRGCYEPLLNEIMAYLRENYVLMDRSYGISPRRKIVRQGTHVVADESLVKRLREAAQ